MNEGISNIDKLCQDDRYLEKLQDIYNTLQRIPRYKKNLDRIESDLSMFLNDDFLGFSVPDHIGFRTYAANHYFPKMDKKALNPLYMYVIEMKDMLYLPDCILCLVLYGDIVRRLNSIADDMDGIIQKNTLSSHSDEEQKQLVGKFDILHRKEKLLYGFMEDYEILVICFINSIDTFEARFLDDEIKYLDALAIKSRLIRAIQTRNKSMSYKLIGRLRDLDEGEDYYFEALAHFIDSEYEEALRYANKIEKGNIDYSSSVALKMHIYSLQGRVDKILICLEENANLEIDIWHICFLFVTASLNLSDECIDERYQNQINQLLKLNIKEWKDSLYEQRLKRLVADILVEGLLIYDDLYSFSGIFTCDVSEKLELRIEALQDALSFFPDHQLKSLLDKKHIEKHGLAEIKKRAEKSIFSLLKNDSYVHDMEDFSKMAICQLRLGNASGFVKNITNNLDALVHECACGENQAGDLLRLAYVESCIIGDVDRRLKEYVELKYNTDDLLSESNRKRIDAFLSARGKLAYRAAEWQFEQSQKEDYGWRDAGPLSLSFYRIIELELNDKVIIPLLSSIGYQRLKNTFEQCASERKKKERSLYRNKWNIILETYGKMELNGFEGAGLMLGAIEHFFAAIGSSFDNTDSLAVLIKNSIPAVLNKYGQDEFERGFFESIINRETRDRYRNPPAHTQYLSYEIACECRCMFEETMAKISKMTLQARI